jgi:hypothetical protein
MEMDEYLNFKSSDNLRNKYSGKTFNLDESENLKDKKSFVNFISSKNKIVLKSCFDHKGAKKFLSDKNKAMDEIVLEDEIPDENIEKRKKKKKFNKKSKTRDKKHLRSESHKALETLGKRRTCDNLKPYHKLLSEKTLPDKNFKSKNNKGQLNSNSDKRNSLKMSSIISNFSNIQFKESLNLAVNKNDSFISSIIKEMVRVKN